MIDAARKYDRLVQIGFQNRSRQNTNATMKFLHEGGIGEVYMFRGMCFKPRESIGNPPNQEVPEGLDYDLWLGSAQEQPFNPNYVHYNWHWHWPFGNGDTENKGPHQFDIARWGLNKDEASVKVSSKGGYYVFDSTQQTPNTQTSIFEYAEGKILQFDNRGLLINGEFGYPGSEMFMIFAVDKIWENRDKEYPTYKWYIADNRIVQDSSEAILKVQWPADTARADIHHFDPDTVDENTPMGGKIWTRPS